MASWANRRKLTYISVTVITLVIVVGVPTFFLLYKPPTCSDGIQNQGEQGIDCGGPCRTLCQSDFLAPSIIWAKYEPVAPGIYNLAAYVENPNINGAAVNVPYSFSVYDNQGLLIVEKEGTMTIPANRNTLAFVGGVNTGQRIPFKVTFQFTAPPLWQKSHDTLSNLVVTNKSYTESANSAALQVTFGNNALTPYDTITTYVVLSDANGNAIGFSKSEIDEIAPGAKTTIPFTWPFSLKGAVVTEDVYPVISPTFDQ